MLFRLQKHRMHWQDGMKLSSEHLKQSDDWVSDQIRDIAGQQLSNTNFGLLPIEEEGEPLHIQINPEATEVEVKACRAVTKSGARIEILEGYTPKVALSLLDLKNRYDIERVVFNLVLRVHPFEHVPFGEIEGGEVPIRQKNAMPKYTLEVINDDNRLNNDAILHGLILAKLRVAKNNHVSVIENYIPPCSKIHVYTPLRNKYEGYAAQIADLRNNCLSIINETHYIKNPNEFTIHARMFAKELVQFCSNNQDYLHIILAEKSPVYLHEFFARLARVVKTYFDCMPDHERRKLTWKSEVQWGDITWRGLNIEHFDESIIHLLGYQYEHIDILGLLNTIDGFMEKQVSLITALLQYKYVERN